MENKEKKKSVEARKKIICDLVRDPVYVPMKEKELAVFLQVAREDREDLRGILQELLAEGKLTLTAKGKYVKSNGRFLTGTFVSNARGFGFVEIEGREEDLYIPEDQTGGAFHKDTVEVALLPESEGRRQEGKIVRIIARGMTRVVGTFERTSENYGFVKPDNTKISQDIFVPKERSGGAVTGHKVVVQITDYGTDRKNPEGQIVEILGHVNDPGVDIMAIVRNYELPVEFTEKIMNQAERVSKEVSTADMAGRRDLRNVEMVTIDGEDAKDLDDAVSVAFDGEKYSLGVHIADVTNYVQENSALDKEALKRGTSVYLVDRVIPMLPHALSNGICSLNEGVDRLALSCLMTVDLSGEIVDYEICESVIRVNKRMSYTVVRELLEEEGADSREEYGQYRDLLPMFRNMESLAAILREKRGKRGSIDFDFPECKIFLDQDGHPTDIRPYERNVATDIIEDFMLAANETVAQHFYWMELPFVYRVHDVPDGERIQKLTAFINNFGYYMKAVGRAGEDFRGRGTSQGNSEASGENSGHSRGAHDQPSGPAEHEAGQIQCGVQRTFRAGMPVLLPFYFTYPQISGPADSPDYKGTAQGTASGRENCPLPRDSAGGGEAFFRDGAQGGRGGAGDGQAEKSGIYGRQNRGNI